MKWRVTRKLEKNVKGFLYFYSFIEGNTRVINDACFLVVTSEIRDCNDCKNCRILINVLFQRSGIFRNILLCHTGISEKELSTFLFLRNIHKYNL